MSFHYGTYPNMGGGASDPRNIDPYQVLGVPRNATSAQIKKAYKRLALLHHPDKVRGDAKAKADANAKFSEISHAYELLTRGRDEQSQGGGGAYRPDAADMAGGFADGQQYQYQQQQQSMPFMGGMGMGMGLGGGFMDPFGAFGGQSMFFGGLGGPAMNPMGQPFPGFQFTDPFDLFRQTFGADPFGTQNGNRGQNNVAGMPPSGGLFSSLMGGMNMPSMPPTGAQGNFTSYSYTSSGTGLGGGDGSTMQTISTTTSITNGKRVTRTERTTINPDGTRQTTVDLSGDDDDERPVQLLEEGSRLRKQRKSSSSTPTTTPPPQGRKRKFGEVTRCLACCFPTLRKRRRIGNSPAQE